jgi:hypothetical protein
MDPTEGSETSAQLISLTPGKYPKESIHDSEHGENLKSRIKIVLYIFLISGNIQRKRYMYCILLHYCISI